MITTKNEVMFQNKINRDSLSSHFERKMLNDIAEIAIRYVTRTVCHPADQLARYGALD